MVEGCASRHCRGSGSWRVSPRRPQAPRSSSGFYKSETSCRWWRNRLVFSPERSSFFILPYNGNEILKGGHLLALFPLLASIQKKRLPPVYELLNFFLHLFLNL